MKQLSCILIGAGQRGNIYSKLAARYPDKYKIIAVAEPIGIRRDAIKKLFGIPDEMCFETWEPLLALPKLADVAVICTMDELHFAPAMAAIEKKYDILLEKPVAPTAAECAAVSDAAEAAGVRIVVCHVLRYTDYFRTLKALIDDGEIGEVMSINHTENVGSIHHSHSFVRGNWHNSKESAPMILAKSCHDFDILQWLIGKKCRTVSSFGSLSYFNAKHRPPDAPDRCIDGCPHAENCIYNAVKIYYDAKDNRWFRTAAAKNWSPTDADILNALHNSDYGKCVFACDNDVVDHQIVNMLFDDDITVSFTMNAFSYRYGGRYTKIYGTQGEINAEMNNGTVSLRHFSDGVWNKIDIKKAAAARHDPGHGGGDEGIISELYNYLTAEKYEGISVSDIRTSTDNHMMAFAAEESRLSGGEAISLDKFIKAL